MEQNQIKNNEVLAAITLALHEYQGYTMHVSETVSYTHLTLPTILRV